MDLKTRSYLGGLAASGLPDENEDLVGHQSFQEFIFMQPNRKCLPLLEYLEVASWVRHASPAVHLPRLHLAGDPVISNDAKEDLPARETQPQVVGGD